MKNKIFIIAIMAALSLIAFFQFRLRSNEAASLSKKSEAAVRQEVAATPVSGVDIPAPIALAEAVEVVEASGSAEVASVDIPDSLSVHASISRVIAKGRYKDRKHALDHELPEDLSAADYKALKDYLLTRPDGKDADFRQHEYAIRNYIMDALRTDKSRLPEALDAFISISSNEDQGDVMRGYALQHLMMVYIDRSQTLVDTDRQRAVETFTAALEDTGGGTIAGTALIGLQEASRADPASVSESSVASAAHKLLHSEEAGMMPS